MRFQKIGITGTPGTGKRTLGFLLASELGFPHILITDAARNMMRSDAGDDEIEVDTSKLARYLKRKLPPRFIVSGHLLPNVLTRRAVDIVIVLRCHPVELEKRLGGRGYAVPKVKANVVAEAIDLVFTEAVRKFGLEKVAEFDTTSRVPSMLLADVLGLLDGRSAAERGAVDWLSALEAEGRLDLLL